MHFLWFLFFYSLFCVTIYLVRTSVCVNLPSLIGVKGHECIFKTRHRLLLWDTAWTQCWRHDNHVHPGTLDGNPQQICSNALLIRQTISWFLQIFLLGYCFVYLCKYEKDVMLHPSERLHTWLLSYFWNSWYFSLRIRKMHSCLAVNVTCFVHISSAEILFIVFMCIYSYSFNP